MSIFDNFLRGTPDVGKTSFDCPVCGRDETFIGDPGDVNCWGTAKKPHDKTLMTKRRGGGKS